MENSGSGARRQASAPEEEPETWDAPPTKFARDVNRIFYAWSEANARMWVSSVQTLSDLFIDVNDAAVESERRGEDARAKRRDGARRGDRDGAAQEGLVEEYGRTLVKFTGIYSRVFKETTLVFRRFYRRLSDIYKL